MRKRFAFGASDSGIGIDLVAVYGDLKVLATFKRKRINFVLWRDLRSATGNAYGGVSVGDEREFNATAVCVNVVIVFLSIKKL